MINFVDDDGNRVPTVPQLRARAGSRSAPTSRMTETFGATHFVPFSSIHRYQRTDSVWANKWTTPVSRGRGRLPVGSRRVAARVRALRRDDRLGGRRSIPRRPPSSRSRPRSSATTGRRRSSATTWRALARYFTGIERLAHALDRIVFRVGGEEHAVELGGRGDRTR